MADATAPEDRGFVGRVRRASTSLANSSPQLGMWQATGTAIAQAPNLTELRNSSLGGDSLEFNAHGHTTRTAIQEPNGELALLQLKKQPTGVTFNTPQYNVDTVPEDPEEPPVTAQQLQRRLTLSEKHQDDGKEKWATVAKNGLKALWKFVRTPAGFCIAIYFLNIVAWGAMLFFLLLDAAPAMDYPSADDNNSARKIWLEIDSQILNALFCVTGFGLAPWRFRDLYYMIRAVTVHDKVAMGKLSEQNKGWFRPPAWACSSEDGSDSSENKDGRVVVSEEQVPTFTGKRAPPTALWKLGFCVSMMAINTLLQVILSFFMWHYNRIDRPGWATGTFIGLGCGSAMFAGLMSWWEGRKVKKIEGPEVRIVEGV
ncbi:hypothetical protein GQ53DRAFT_745892 [Thozetella sp. PMI_491]|nr:hypothetical protein GQ53DRAFT_745892 [Thozetella sp. PMI_491]